MMKLDLICPFCGHQLIGGARVHGPSERPSDGDIAVCMACEKAAIFDASAPGGLRKPTRKEQAQIEKVDAKVAAAEEAGRPTVQPEIIKVEYYPEPDLTALHESAIAYAIERFNGKEGRVPPTWVVAAVRSRIWMVTDWESTADKDFSVWAVKRLLDSAKASHYAFTTEAFVAATEGLGPDETKALIEHADEHGVGSLPKKFRDDVLLVSSFGRDGAALQTRFLVTERPRGPNLLGPRVDEDLSEAGGFSGRMWNLFEQLAERQKASTPEETTS